MSKKEKKSDLCQKHIFMQKCYGSYDLKLLQSKSLPTFAFQINFSRFG